MSVRPRNNTGYGLGIAAFAISVINLILFFGLAYFIFFENKPVCQNHGAEICVKTIEESSLPSESQESESEEKGKISDSEKDMIYQAVRGTTLEKNKKIDSAKEVSKLIWVALREHYNKHGQYPPEARDIFGTGSVPHSLNISEPPGKPYFYFDILGNGQVQARPNTVIDPSLSDVSNIMVSTRGSVTGGNY